MVNATPLLPHPLERPGIHCTGGWDGPRTILVACDLVPAGIRFPDRPALSESLHRLSSPVPHPKYSMTENSNF